MPPRRTPTTPAELRAAQDYWWEHPAAFASDVLGVDLWSTQLAILESVRDNPETSVASCHAGGKTLLAAVAVLLFLYCRGPARVLSTAPGARQVKHLLWMEIRRLHKNARVSLGGKLLQQELHLDEGHFAIGFAAPEYNPVRFQGWHETNLLAVVDEAAGVADSIYDAIGGTLSGGFVRQLNIGNPTDPSGYFGRSFKHPVESRGVSKFNISAFDTPNFTDSGITLEDIKSGAWVQKWAEFTPRWPGLVTPGWVARRLLKWREGSPLWTALVMGQFPSTDLRVLIPPHLMLAAQERELEASDPVEVSCDVARSGSAFSVVGLRRGPVYRRVAKINGADLMEVTGHVRQAQLNNGGVLAKIDTVGLGGGVFDRCVELNEEAQREQKPTMPVAEMCAGGKPRDTERYPDARSEWAWGLRERFEDGDIDVDPEDEDLAGQLTSVRWKPDSRGRIRLESKDEMAKRGMDSPDDADACMMCFGQPRKKPKGQKRGRLVLDLGQRANPWEI